MAQAATSRPAGGERPVRYAGFWRRLCADIVDNLILLPLASVPMPLLTEPPHRASTLARELAQNLAAHAGQQLLMLLVGVAYSVFFWVRYLGTPGKLLFRCRVVDAQTHAALSVSQSLLRNLGYIVSALPCMLGFLWIAWDPRKQGFHDKIAGTVVLYAPPAASTRQRVL
ncbi:MAG: RDD family protein [Gammaproteobacteria bacterium]|nr:RDD family protein [Gammaproteobacteria bacterium]